MDISNNLDLEHDILVNRLKNYLGDFFVKPYSPDSPNMSLVQSFFSTPYSVGHYQAFYAPDKADFYPFIQAIILSFNKRISWKELTVPLLLQETFDSENIIDPLFSLQNTDLLILWNFDNEVPNVRKYDVIAQIFDARALSHKHTLFLTTRNNLDKIFSVKNLTNSAEISPAVTSKRGIL